MCFIIYPLFPQSQWPWSLQTPVCPLEQVHWCPLWQSARLKFVMIHSSFNKYDKRKIHLKQRLFGFSILIFSLTNTWMGDVRRHSGKCSVHDDSQLPGCRHRYSQQRWYTGLSVSCWWKLCITGFLLRYSAS